MDLTPLAAWNGEGANLFVSPRLISALDPHGIDRAIRSHGTLDLYMSTDGEDTVLVDQSGGCGNVNCGRVDDPIPCHV